uniref:hypothetical protein n=1 Tax=Flavobacterium sp. TaxID=239 RepID=UPI00374D773F
ASDSEAYKLMFENVSNRLQKEKSELDTIINKELKIKTKKTQDSLKKLSKIARKNTIITKG